MGEDSHVIIEVDGGVCRVLRKPEGISIEVRDYDLQGGSMEPNATDERGLGYVSENLDVTDDVCEEG